MIELNKVYCGPWEQMKSWPDGFINTCVTSPPYYNLRDYGMDNQIGLEETPEQFIEKLVEVFREVKRVLRDDGTLWVNIGDSYASTGKNRTEEQVIAKTGLSGSTKSQQQGRKRKYKVTGDLKPKDLIGIPWMLAFALRADGWFLRQDIIWHKPNGMPESVTDRCTKNHEYIFMLSKSSKYFYDYEAIKTEAIKTEAKNPEDDIRRLNQQKVINKSNPTDKVNGLRPRVDKQRGHSRKHAGFNDRWDSMTNEEQRSMGANKRSVWTVAPSNFREAHFATFPEALILDCIKAGCPEGGVVLDPFMGSGTTGLVSQKLNRNFIGTELNPEYCKIAYKRLKSLFNNEPISF